MKRIMLFLATNLAVIVLLGIILRLIGFEGILDANGVDLNLGALLVFAAVVGFTGAFISLAMSKWTAKRMMGVRVITQPANSSIRRSRTRSPPVHGAMPRWSRSAPACWRA